MNSTKIHVSALNNPCRRPYIQWRPVRAIFAAAAFACISVPAMATGTLAGTDIVNVAQASYDAGGGTITVDSNTVTIKVDELLDITVASSDPGDVTTTPGASAQLLTYQITNTGNGSEAFTLTADTAKPGDEFDTSFEQIVLDSNDNGVYDEGVDTVYTPGSNDPVLNADQSLAVFILSTIPADPDDGDRAEIELSASANTGTGSPGDTFAGQGDGGGDAVVGATRATAAGSGFFVIQSADVSLVKSAVIVDQFGGAEAVPGALITFQIIATTTGSGTLNALTISDNIPANTSYVEESITVEGVKQTDSDADADNGSFNGSAISAALGAVTGGQTRTISFQVTIN